MSPAGKHPDFECPSTIVLVGMMGVGKTTIGRRLAPRLGLPFFDADAEIEAAAGMSVSELFTTHGEKSFRDGEARVIERLLAGPPHVLATGGGAVTHDQTRFLIKEKAIAVWIKADPDVLAVRATRRDTRPLLREGDPVETLRKLVAERTPYYAEAEIHIESQPGPHVNTVNLIIKKIAGHFGHDMSAEGACSQ